MPSCSHVFCDHHSSCSTFSDPADGIRVTSYCIISHILIRGRFSKFVTTGKVMTLHKHLWCHTYDKVCHSLEAHHVWPKPSSKAQWKGEEDKADRERGVKTTSGNGQAWRSASPRGQWRTGKMEELVAKSSVVPQRPSRLRDRCWRWWLRDGMSSVCNPSWRAMG